MSDIIIQCGKCQRRVAAKPHLAGKTAKCPGCGAPIVVPSPTGTSSIQLTCDLCLAQFRVASKERGTAVACPSCGNVMTAGSSGGTGRFRGGPAASSETAQNPLEPLSHPTTGRPMTLRGLSRSGHFAAPTLRNNPAALAQYGLMGAAVLAGAMSFLICWLAGRMMTGGSLLLAGLIIAGCGLAFPPRFSRGDSRPALSIGTILASAMGIALFVAMFLLVAGAKPAMGAAIAGRLIMSMMGSLLLALAMIGFVYLVIRFGFSRPASAYYSLAAVAFALAMSVSFPGPGRGSGDLASVERQPRSMADVHGAAVPSTILPNLGPPRSIAPGVEFREIRLPVAPDQPGRESTLYVYTPKGHHAPQSLPCVLIAPAGAFPLTGMTLSHEDQAEHTPYVRAGYVVVAYEVDGHVVDQENASDDQLVNAIKEYWASGAGIVNATNAITFALAKIPEVDPHQLYTAGHSSAALQALLLAENDPRIKGCIAYAPVVDLQARIRDQLPVYRAAIPNIDTLIQLGSPRAGEDRLHCPVFLFHAVDDDVVPASESMELAQRLSSRGEPVKLESVPTGGHYEAMISQGIPQGIAWLTQLSGVTPPSGTMGSGTESLANHPSFQPSPQNRPDSSPPADPQAKLAQHREALEKIRDRMASGRPMSSAEMRRMLEGKDTDASGEKQDDGEATGASDENPFEESPFEEAPAEEPSGEESPFEIVEPDSMAADSSSTAGQSPPATARSTEKAQRQIEQLVQQLKTGNVFEKRDALQALAKTTPPESPEDKTRQTVIQTLHDVAIDEDVFSQKEAITALGRWGDASSADLLLTLLADGRSRSLNDEIYRALGQLKDPRSAMAVCERLGEFFDRDAAEACLRAMGPVAEDALLIAAPSSNGEISLRAVRVLGDVGTEKCLPTLRQGLRSRNPAVKEASRTAIKKVRLRQTSSTGEAVEHEEDD